MTGPIREINFDVAVVGGGPSGLSAARRLRELGAGRVVVIDRESDLGGIPRHCFHSGYGLRDLRRSLSGPAYARRLADLAIDAGVDPEVGAMVTGWSAAGELELTTPSGLKRVTAKAVVLATGARERPRSARLVAGDRAGGIYTTGQLQQAVYLRHQKIGSRAVIVGAELVSHSALLTLAHAGVEVVAMVTDQPRVQTLGLVNRGLGVRVRHELITSVRVVSIAAAQGRTTGVDLDNGRGISCDTVVFTGDWIADHELARAARLAMDPASTGPVVDTAFRSSREGVFAIGNLVHPVETADRCALDGISVADSVIDYLDHGPRHDAVIDVIAGEAVSWVSPGKIRFDGRAAPGRFTIWPDKALRSARVAVSQGDKPIATRRLIDGAVPGRPVGLSARFVGAVDPEGPPVRVSLV